MGKVNLKDVVEKRNKGVYIPSIEACELWEHMNRGNYIKKKYVGMIPYSLELIQLRKKGLLTFNSKRSPKKELSNDIINVKFNQKVDSGKQLIKILNKKVEKLNETEEEYKVQLVSYIEKIQSELEQKEFVSKWNEVKGKDLREELYINGFTITQLDYETGEIISKDTYKFYKRSSSKSRKGECLFIKDSLYDEMIKWSRMDIPFEDNQKIDLAGLLAYESLVGSTIENTIVLNPDNILIVDDVKSTFNEVCNVVRTGKDGYLDSFEKSFKVSNEIFDGEALLSSNKFKDGQSMMLLRNHMFKAAAFSTNLQLFFKDYFKDEYETKFIIDMFGNEMKVTDIEMIITPSCLKALKFADVISESNHKKIRQKEMWNHWKTKVKEDGSLFGICKHEKATSRGYHNEKPLQQTSYQMLNSLPAGKEVIKNLSQFERDYIMELKNNDDVFIEYIKNNKNEVNSNEMFAKLYDIHKDIVKTKIFREFRTKTISNYVKYIKKGKIRLNTGDYVVLLGNPVEFLRHAVGEKITKPLALKDNEVYCTLFDFDKELVGFRNPHTSPSNVLKVMNKDNGDIKKYFELSPNIVVINTIKFNALNILSGADFDSDNMVLFDNPDLLKLANDCYGKYKVCINDVESEPKQYTLNLKDIAEIDNSLANDYIGRVVNLGQLCMSLYWDRVNRGWNPKSKKMKDLLKKVDVMTVLSGICIDLAKKFYDIKIPEEIEHVANGLELKTNKDNATLKPNFWRYVSENKNTKYAEYQCPMDYLYEEMNNLKGATPKQSLDLASLLQIKNSKKGNRKQIPRAQQLADELQSKIGGIKKDGGSEEEMNIKIEDTTNEYTDKFGKLKVNENTMYAILLMISKQSEDIKSSEENEKEKPKNKSFVRLMNQLYKTQGDTFLKAFKLAK